MSSIQGGRWDDYLRRMFSIKATSIAPAVGAEIVPIATVIPDRAEDRILRGDKMYMGYATGPAVAAQYAYVNLRNDSPDHLVIIEDAFTIKGATIGIDCRMGNTALGTGPATITGRDTRLGITLTGRSQAGAIRYGSGVAISGTPAQYHGALANTMVHITCPIVLEPLSTFLVWVETVNISLTVTFVWRERLAEPGELTVA